MCLSEGAEVCSVLHSGTKSKAGAKSVLRPPATPPSCRALCGFSRLDFSRVTLIQGHMVEGGREEEPHILVKSHREAERARARRRAVHGVAPS